MNATSTHLSQTHFLMCYFNSNQCMPLMCEMKEMSHSLFVVTDIAFATQLKPFLIIIHANKMKIVMKFYPSLRINCRQKHSYMEFKFKKKQRRRRKYTSDYSVSIFAYIHFGRSSSFIDSRLQTTKKETSEISFPSNSLSHKTLFLSNYFSLLNLTTNFSFNIFVAGEREFVFSFLT